VGVVPILSVRAAILSCEVEVQLAMVNFGVAALYCRTSEMEIFRSRLLGDDYRVRPMGKRMVQVGLSFGYDMVFACCYRVVFHVPEG
jgi:hypothetical protein